MLGIITTSPSSPLPRRHADLDRINIFPRGETTGPDGLELPADGSPRARRTGDYIITHQLQIYLQSDSTAAKLVTRMFGDSAPKMAEQGTEQLLMFFSGIAKYAHDKPEKAKSLLGESGR